MLYETILCFPNFPLDKKKRKYEKFRGPFKQGPGAPPLKSASDRNREIRRFKKERERM